MQVTTLNNNVHRSLAGFQKDKVTLVQKPTKNKADQLIEFEQALMSMQVCHEMK